MSNSEVVIDEIQNYNGEIDSATRSRNHLIAQAVLNGVVTQRRIATALGISQSAVSQIVARSRGEAPESPDRFQRLMESFRRQRNHELLHKAHGGEKCEHPASGETWFTGPFSLRIEVKDARKDTTVYTIEREDDHLPDNRYMVSGSAGNGIGTGTRDTVHDALIEMAYYIGIMSE